MHLRRFLILVTATAIKNKYTLVSCCTNNMTELLKTNKIQRLTDVKGIDDKRNDLIYHPPENPSEGDGYVFFFGGDVQDYPESMITHRDNKRHVQWNLENTAEILHKKFRHKKVFVVRPSRMHLRTFSCFDNFVSSNSVGSPEHSLCINGLRHLYALYQNAKMLTSTKEPLQQCDTDSLILVGFSKGCVVLNQLLYSFAALAENESEELNRFVRDIGDMYWLDGGHSGGSNTWITNKKILGNLVQLPIRIHIDVTPYQVKDVTRPWNGQEEKIFRETLRHLGVGVERRIHFEDQPHSIESHFKVLEVF